MNDSENFASGTVASLIERFNQLERIVPSKLSGEEAWRLNGEWVSLDAVRELAAAQLTTLQADNLALKKTLREWSGVASSTGVATAPTDRAEDLLATCKRVADWLGSFSMPPTSTITEKQEHLALLEAAIAKAEQ